MRPFSLNINGRLIEYNQPAIMGIINATPDSFYAESRCNDPAAIRDKAAQMVADGAEILDIGAYSSRPGGCDDIPQAEEIRRLETAITAIRDVAPDIPLSIDTFRSEVAQICITQLSANIINDISGGDMDPEMFNTVARLQVPYILMHMRGTPQNMTEFNNYDNIIEEVMSDLAIKVDRLSRLGVNDIIIDPGFGFSKNLEQNYMLLSHLSIFNIFHLPILVGISRKSMITQLLDIPTAESLNGTTALNMLLLERGACILRVHDVASAAQAVKIYEMTKAYKSFMVSDI